MSRITKPLRSRGPVKRLDLTDMRSLFRDRRMWSAFGIVTEPDDGDAHWEIVTNDDGDAVDVLIEVVLHPSEEQVTCRLRGGMWEVPNVGDEVAVLVPEGERDFMPIIVCKLSSASVPTGSQGVAPGRIVIVPSNGEKVYVHDGNGGTDALVKRSEFLAHGHPTAGTGPVSPPTAATPIADTGQFPGTTVLKAK